MNLRRSTAQRASLMSAHDNVMGCVPRYARLGMDEPMAPARISPACIFRGYPRRCRGLTWCWPAGPTVVFYASHPRRDECLRHADLENARLNLRRSTVVFYASHPRRVERRRHADLENARLNLCRSAAQRASPMSAHDNVMGCVPCHARFDMGVWRPPVFHRNVISAVPTILPWVLARTISPI